MSVTVCVCSRELQLIMCVISECDRDRAIGVEMTDTSALSADGGAPPLHLTTVCVCVFVT